MDLQFCQGVRKGSMEKTLDTIRWQKHQISLVYRTLGSLLREGPLFEIIGEQTARKYYHEMKTKPLMLSSARWPNLRQRGLPMRIFLTAVCGLSFCG